MKPTNFLHIKQFHSMIGKLLKKLLIDISIRYMNRLAIVRPKGFGAIQKLNWCRLVVLFLVASFLTACGQRHIPQEITALHLPPKSLPPSKHEIIIVDAGHGGKDAGASSKREKYEEKALTLETAFLISNYLEQIGYKTILTRSHDIYVPLHTRAEIANATDADLFVSIHYNYSSSQEAEG